MDSLKKGDWVETASGIRGQIIGFSYDGQIHVEWEDGSWTVVWPVALKGKVAPPNTDPEDD
jgi:preprotein translocase subunit YajC